MTTVVAMMIAAKILLACLHSSRREQKIAIPTARAGIMLIRYKLFFRIFLVRRQRRFIALPRRVLDTADPKKVTGKSFSWFGNEMVNTMRW